MPKVCTPAAARGALLPAVWGLSRARLPGLWPGVAEPSGPVLQAMWALPTTLAGQRVCLYTEAHPPFAFTACILPMLDHLFDADDLVGSSLAETLEVQLLDEIG